MESDNESNASESSNSSENSQTVEEVTEQDRDKIREQLSTMSFEDLQKLKNKMGAKMYNETVFGVKKKVAKIDYKRANKNRPREMSSKRPISVKNNVITVKKHIPRDPRFDPLCGTFDEKIFKSNYKFLKNIKKDERMKLEEEYKKATSDEDRKKIKLLMQRLDNQIREQEKKEQKDARLYEEKREIKEKLKRGEKPVFKKKSVRKVEDLITQYEELKKTNKLQKHIEKRSKKLAMKEKKLRKNIKT